MASAASYGNVGSKFTQQASDTPGCPVFSPKLVHDFDDTDVTITGTFVTLFTYTGSGKFVGFSHKFSSIKVQVKLTIDSNVIFDLKMEDIKDLVLMGQNNKIAFDICGLRTGDADDNDDLLQYCPDCPIEFKTDVKIEAKKVSGGDKTVDKRLTILTKET